METNILTSLHAKLEEFKDKKIQINDKIKELTRERDANEKSISELQTKNISLSSQVKGSTEEFERLETMIEEIQSGYNSLLETGECLMNLMNSNRQTKSINQ
jgi:uncharacterized coiled-coil DUF342 family protein